jgi:GNAT superfamily N-acetyltransferase
MHVDIAEERMPDLAEYARVPIAFEVRQVLELAVLDGGLGGFVLSERGVDPPYMKDYDALEAPASWPEDGRRVGGAAIAFDSPDVHMLEGRRDLAVLWDIRVAPEARGHGVGAALFRAAEAWAAARGCRQMKIETQNVNLPACRFYARQGCVLGAIHRFAYPALPHEVQLLWYRDLAR